MFLRRVPQLFRKTNIQSRCLASDAVQLSNTQHKLTYVESVDTIDSGPIIDTKYVEAFELSNDMDMKVKVMREGGNMVQITKNDKDYVWDNIEGACHYGANTSAFPKTTGLILHGGIRFAAVTAEHGLYYETDWDVEHVVSDDGKSRSVILSIQDTEEQRKALNDPLSEKQFCVPIPKGQPNYNERLNRYPVSNLIFKYEIKLNAGEEFVRLKMSVENPTDKPAKAEAWLPMTYPIEKDSQIISQQKYRWKRDDWCFAEKPQIVKFEGEKDLNTPLEWPTGGIYYDWPTMDGHYHAVNKPSTGQGVAYVVNEASNHFMKLWSWGNRDNFHRETATDLEKGRPAAEYYEPWGSAFNFAFFQTTEFPAKSEKSWEACIVPIESGLTDTCNKTLQKKVEAELVKKKVYVPKPTDEQTLY